MTALRKIGALAAAALLVAGVGLTSVAVAEDGGGTDGRTEARSVLPRHGNYSGVDQHGRVVTFSFSGNYMSHFTVSTTVIGGAHVGSTAWHETCHNGMCTRGTWVSDTHVTGAWRHGSGAWTHFSATFQPPVVPYVGPYMGQDHPGLKVKFSYRSGAIIGFELDHSNRGNITVTHNRFDTCLPSICVRGHWQSDYSVVGVWRPVGGSHWFQWEVHAYAF